jgi:hypothetical protein
MGSKEMSISKILQGIDQDVICDKDGWWETSAGAEFGRLKLVEAHGYEFGLLSRIEALEKASQWQPIETAPKDGTEVLIFGGMFSPTISNKSPCRSATKARFYDSEWNVVDIDGYGIEVILPTHWTPLPKPPAISDKSE